MSIVAKLEHTFLPLFHDAAEVIGAEYPEYKFSACSWSIGGATEYQGHNIGVQCIFPDASDDEADNVAALIGAKHLTSQPKLCEAYVAWGEGNHPDVTIDLLDTPILFSEQTLQQVANHVPQLLAIFRQAVQSWSVREKSAG